MLSAPSAGWLKLWEKLVLKDRLFGIGLKHTCGVGAEGV